MSVLFSYFLQSDPDVVKVNSLSLVIVYIY